MNVLLTGASRGLGLEIARQQIAAGNTVYAVSRTMSDGLQELVETAPELLKHVPCDLSSLAEVQRVFALDIPDTVSIGGFVSNAAIAYDDLVTNMNHDRLQEMFQTNVFAPLNLTKLTIRRMLLHKTAGSIVHISSICVHTGYKGLAMYAATKGAVEAFSKNTAREWGTKGIRSNCVVAGFMETEMSEGLSEEQKQRIYNRSALKEATSITSVAATVGHLLSGASSSITGQNLFVDSGTI